jgi:indolepyruvate ferredoxin oxidoreductase alpha subunit
LVEQAFALSEVSNTPVMMEFRIRACHVHGRFAAKDNRRPAISKRDVMENPDFDFDRICLPPASYAQEKHKIEARKPAALRFIAEHKLNEYFPGARGEVGIILQGGLYNSVIRALQQLDLADAYGKSQIPLGVLNVTYPLVAGEIEAFCADKRAVLVVEEGQPAFLEEAIGAILRRAGLDATLVGKGVLPEAGEYTAEVLLRGVAGFLEGAVPTGLDLGKIAQVPAAITAIKEKASVALGRPMPKRPPAFCTGCPERPVFTAIKLVEREIGRVHVAADIGCHTFSTLPPFNIGNSVLGYGLGLASAAAVAPAMKRRSIAIMGDGGFWHNGLATGVGGALFNQSDSVLVIMNNGYTSATGQQNIPSSVHGGHGAPTVMTIRRALRGVGVKWLKTVTTYKVSRMMKTLKQALTTPQKGLKVIIAESECQLALQRRIKPRIQARLKGGGRVVRVRYGVDEDVCTGDHSCIRLSGCPSLTVRPNPDPLRSDPVAHVDQGCVGCGLCGEVADAAILCPSFYRAAIVQNPNAFDRLLDRTRRGAIASLGGGNRKAA